MNPIKRFHASAIIVTLLTTGITAPWAYVWAEESTPPPLIEDGSGGFVLEDLVVVRRTGIDDVKLEKDGSFSLLRDDSSTVFSALNSGSGAAVNFDIAFAKHSVVMTADGQLTIETIARAVRLIGADQPFVIVVKHNPELDPSGRRGLTQSRADAILAALKQRHGIKSEVSIKFGRSSSGIKEVGRSQLLAVTIVNSGSDSMAVQ